MMINKRLIGMVPESKKHIKKTVLFQWVSMAANAAVILSVTYLLDKVLQGTAETANLICTAVIAIAAVTLRAFMVKASTKESFLASKTVKGRLREMIYDKLLRLGSSYREELASSEVVQVAVEGVAQLETYFGSYLPQFFYSMLAPLTLFVLLCPVSFPAALVLLLCVPLIPMTIAAVQTFAKKLLGKYWTEYTTLGDTFLENLQGLTTLKIYGTDDLKHKEMNEESERFRKITMRVLTMQLNSITIMDVIAYGGAALGLIVAAVQMSHGTITFGGGLAIVLLAAEFFIPMRMLGSFFHIAMNGMAASDKIFRLLDLPEPDNGGGEDFPQEGGIALEDVHFGYTKDREILHGVSLSFPKGSFTAIVGESGCGKSTVASLIMGRLKGYTGKISVGGVDLRDIREESLLKNLTYVGFDSHIFKGTVGEDLRMACPEADDAKLWSVLEQVKLADFLRGENGLDTAVLERGSNFSGGQRQRLALARAILHDSPVYIFDEATSNVDVESENDIMEQIRALAKERTVILITHRLANAEDAQNVYAMERGSVVESGTHSQLLAKNGLYARLWNTQSQLENFSEEA